MIFPASHALVAALFGASAAFAGSPLTCSSPQLSCQNTTVVTDTCCFNAPGGQLLLTQFWDTAPSTGPETSWTIHGLWPDRCDGTYDASCDSTRAYKNITSILTAAGKTALVDYMNKYWVDLNGNEETFWQHEWAKHGTCISTLEPRCYTRYEPTQEVPDYFQKAVDLFKSLDSYQILSTAGIVPSTSKTYTSAEIQAAFTKSSFGFPVSIQCNSGALNEIRYAFNVRGSVQSGTFVPVVGSGSNCPSTGIKYLPKSTGTKPTTTGGPTPTTATTCQGSTPTGAVFSGSGFLNAYTGGSRKGCLISAGTWYITGTCATYTATPVGSGFTLTSSKGPCGISNSFFTCGAGVTATIFSRKACNNLLAYNGKTNFYASAVPRGSIQEVVSTKTGSVTVTLEWQSK